MVLTLALYRKGIPVTLLERADAPIEDQRAAAIQPSSLEMLAELGITAVQIMPVADFPGRRNWGYDGVLLFAPDSAYGRPEDLKAFVDAAHRLGLMVFLDVVYNHLGPEANFLPGDRACAGFRGRRNFVQQ